MLAPFSTCAPPGTQVSSQKTRFAPKAWIDILFQVTFQLLCYLILEWVSLSSDVLTVYICTKALNWVQIHSEGRTIAITVTLCVLGQENGAHELH
jgi:hypothetical protein